MTVLRLAVDELDSAGMRADLFIVRSTGTLTRSQLKARHASLSVNGKAAKLSCKLKPGDSLVVELDDPLPTDLVPENIPLEILFENADAIVINKPQGMVVHPAAGNPGGTLVNALLHHAGFTNSHPEAASGVRPGIVHRLDKDTSGVLIAAKSAEAQEFLARQFRDRTVSKSYIALADGSLPQERGSVKTMIARDPRERKRFAVAEDRGKLAFTSYRVLRRFGNYTLVSLHPRTGRTHQLRVHLKWLGCPILGDPIYGRSDPAFRDATLMLHAYRLRVLLPGETESRIFTAPLPERFRRILGKLKKEGDRS